MLEIGVARISARKRSAPMSAMKNARRRTLSQRLVGAGSDLAARSLGGLRSPVSNSPPDIDPSLARVNAGLHRTPNGLQCRLQTLAQARQQPSGQAYRCRARAASEVRSAANADQALLPNLALASDPAPHLPLACHRIDISSPCERYAWRLAWIENAGVTHGRVSAGSRWPDRCGTQRDSAD